MYASLSLSLRKSIRTHSLIQSSQLLNSFHKFGIENDVSLFLENTSNIQPHYSKYLKLFRFPFFWEDDITMFYGFSKDHIEEIIKKPGMKIFNFHPIHIYLNSKTIKNYKEAIKNKKMQEAYALGLEGYMKINPENGQRECFKGLYFQDPTTYPLETLWAEKIGPRALAKRDISSQKRKEIVRELMNSFQRI